MEPRGERRVATEKRRFAGQRDEDVLRHFLRESGVAEAAQRSRINQVNVLLDEALKGPFGASVHILPQQLLVAHSVSAFHLINCRRNRETEKIFSSVVPGHSNWKRLVFRRSGVMLACPIRRPANAGMDHNWIHANC